MCAIAGFAGRDGSAGDLEALAAAMAARLSHRGPDGAGAYADAACGVGLGHQRLAVVELGPSAAQPLVSADGRYALVYNGEVYNHRALRVELERAGARFHGHGDSEVLLAACAHWGVPGALAHLEGMYAFALWDHHERTLHLVRDPLGIKPLYWAQLGNELVFGSELKALTAHPAWRGELDPAALRAYVRSRYVPAPLSIYRGVHKLPAGSLLRWRPGRPVVVERYWSPPAPGLPGAMPAKDAQEHVSALLDQAVTRCLGADVPLGAFLSGGTDSATVVALMQRAGGAPVRTFTVSFPDPRYDEAPRARQIARHLGTDHTEIHAGETELAALIPELPHWYDEPFADASQLPTLLLARAVRGAVTVALSGDGGDEVFGGYDHYFATARLSGPAQRSGLGVLATVLTAADRFLPLSRPTRRRVGKWAGHAVRRASKDEGTLYRHLTDKGPGVSVLDAALRRGPERFSTEPVPGGALSQRLAHRDLLSSLPDRMLAKVDRASMAAGLEVRVPLLDTALLDYVWRLPPALRFDAARRKPLLRAVTDRYLPAGLLDQPKHGFSVPLRAWLRGPLRGFAEELLAPARLRADGIFDARAVRTLWMRHLAGHADHHHALWAVLMFQLWHRHVMTTASRPAA